MLSLSLPFFVFYFLWTFGSVQLPLADNREDQVNFRFGPSAAEEAAQMFFVKASSTPAGVPTRLRVFTHASRPSKRGRARRRKSNNKNKNIAAVNARRRRRRNPGINYLEARRHETSSGRVRFERFTKFAEADTQMVLQKKKKKKKRKVKQGDERDSDMTAAVFG